MFYRYEHYMSISHMAIFVYMATQQYIVKEYKVKISFDKIPFIFSDHFVLFLLSNKTRRERTEIQERLFSVSLLPLQWSDLYIYIVIHRQICFVLSELFSLARYARFPKLGSKPGWLSQEKTSASEGNLNAYVSQLFLFTYISLTATESSIHMKSLALYIYIYIYIYIYYRKWIYFNPSPHNRVMTTSLTGFFPFP